MEILTGPACSGKTSSLLQQYRSAVWTAQRPQRPGRTLWLGPTRRVCEQVRRQLWSPQTPVILSPQVLTFDGFADQILQFSTEVTRPLPPVMQRVLVRHLIDELAAAGKLKYFSGIAQTSGFLDVVLGLIAELKREEAWPEDFQSACAKKGASRADQELGAVYAAYQDQLVRQHRYDSEGRFWSARDRLFQGHWEPFTEFDLVVVDGFSDFTHTQYEILGLLAQRAARMIVSLPWEETSLRPDLFAKPQIAISRLKDVAACELTTCREGDALAEPLKPVAPNAAQGIQRTLGSPRPRTRGRGAGGEGAGATLDFPSPPTPLPGVPGRGGASMVPQNVSASNDARGLGAEESGGLRPPLAFGIRQLASHLFSNPREIVPSPHAEGLEILAVTGMQGEVRAIAERVKRLLIAGVAARDIVVAFRPVADYAPLVREVFSTAGIPFLCVDAEPLYQSPLIKALLSVLQLELEDWPFERLTGLLNSGWFRPRWSEWWAERTPRIIAKVLRQAKIPHGRSSVLGACETARQAVAEGTLEEDLQAGILSGIDRAGHCLRLLSDVLQSTRQKQSAREWATTLTHIARELGIAPQSEAADGAEAMAAWKSFEDLLFVAAGTEEMLGQGRRRLDLAEIYAELSDLLKHQMLPTPPRQIGTVEILSAEQVRGLDVPYLFLGGLTESSFPQRGGDSFLYTEADRRELNSHGLTLGQRTAQTQSEMLLFYSIVTRARNQLTLSYPAVSLDGQPLSASPYLTTLRDLFLPESLKLVRIEQLDPVPAVENMLSLSDLRVVATSEALQKRPRWFQTLAAQPTGWDAARSILAAIDMSVERFQTRGFTTYEGMITQTANRQWLMEKFSPEREFSATQLEGYAQCPFRFWVTDVLKIREVDAPDQFTDHRRRGDIVHDILLQLHSQLEPTPDEVPIGSAVEVFCRLLAERLSQQLAGSELLAALIRIEQRVLDEWGGEYAQQWSDYHAYITKTSGAFLKPALFEVSFGTPHTPDPDNPATPCLALGAGASETRIRGRIDRIDVGEISGQPVFNIIDYKTGRKPSTTASHLQSGKSLQLVLYALATQRLNLAGDNAIPIQTGYWCLKETGWSPISKPPKAGANGLEQHAEWLALVDVLDDLVPRLAAGIRSGQFPVYNTDTGCMSYCAYRTTCRVSQIRPLEESLAKQWDPS